MNVFEGDNRKRITSTDSTIKSPNSGPQLFLLGVFVSQASNTPTLTVADSLDIIANTFTPAAGQFYILPCQINGTLTVTIGGTVDATIFYGSN